MSTRRTPPQEGPANDVPSSPVSIVGWRTVAREAADRGLSARALRELCRAHNVQIRGRGKYQMVRPREVDSIYDRLEPALSADEERAEARAAAAADSGVPSRRPR